MGRPKGQGLAAVLVKAKARKMGGKNTRRKEEKTNFEDEDEAGDIPDKVEEEVGERETDTVLEEFANKENHTVWLLARLQKLAVILGTKQFSSVVSMDDDKGPKSEQHEKYLDDMAVDGLKALAEKRLQRRSDYYSTIVLFVFGCVFFATICMQMNASQGFSIENPLLRAYIGDLDAESYVINRAEDILDWLDTAVVGAAFEDAQCGNGQCEEPFEYPGFGRFGCEADCGKYQKTSNIMLDFAEIAQVSASQGWDWSKVPRRDRPVFTYNIWSDTMGDWLFEHPLVANGTQVVVEVPDGKFRVQLFQKHQMTSLVTTDDLEKHLLIARGTEPQRNPAISDFHFGDTAEMTASAAVLLGQIEDYCNSMDWAAADSTKLDLNCALEPKMHTYLKALSSYGVQGKVTISQKGSKQVFTLASLDFCSLVPDAGMGLKSARNKKMIVSAGIACPISARRSLSDGGWNEREGISLRAAAGSVSRWQQCSTHRDCKSDERDNVLCPTAGPCEHVGMFCGKDGLCNTCPFCQQDESDSINGTCPRDRCPLSGGLPRCINGTLLASFVNAGPDVANSTTCLSSKSFEVWNFHRKGSAVAVVPTVDTTSVSGGAGGRFLTPFNMIVGPVVIDQARYATRACKTHGNKFVSNFSAGDVCVDTGSLSVGDDATTDRFLHTDLRAYMFASVRAAFMQPHASCSDTMQSEGAKAETDTTLDNTPYGLDPTFLATSDLYEGFLRPETWYSPEERLSIPLDFSNPKGPSRLHIPLGFFPHGHLARKGGTSAQHIVKSRRQHFVAFIDPSCSATQAHRMVAYLREGGFLDGQTKEVSVETMLFNVEHQMLALLKMVFTWQIGGSITWDYTLMPVPLDLYSNPAQSPLEMICIVLLVLFVLAELYQVFQVLRGLKFDYFTGFGNWLDWVHMLFLAFTFSRWFVLVSTHRAAITKPEATAVLADAGAAARLFEVDNQRVQEWLAFQEDVHAVGRQRQIYSALAGISCLLFVFRLLKSFDFQSKLSVVSKILRYSGNDQLHFFCLSAIIWVSFSLGTVLAFGHQFESASTFSGASQMWWDAMLTWDPGLFWDQMAHAAYEPWVFGIFVMSFFIILSVLVINILVCLLIDAYVIAIEDSRNALPVWTEFYDVLWHDFRSLFRPRTKFMSDQRFLEVLQEMHLVANHPSGFAVLRKLVMKQLDHHRGRVIATSDHEITVPPFDLLELIRGNDAVHNQDEVRKVIEALELENKIFHPQNGGENDDEDHVLTMDAANNGGIVDHKAGYDEQHHVSLKGNTHKELGALILMNHISEKDVSQELVDHALQAVFADSHEQHKLEDLMERYGSTEQEMESMQADEVLEVIEKEVERNKILSCRAYIDMANKLQRICAFAHAIQLHAVSVNSTSATNDARAFRFKKTISEMVAEQRVKKLLSAQVQDRKQTAQETGDMLQLTIVEAVNLPKLDRGSMVDSSCTASLLDENGLPTSRMPLSTDTIVATQNPKWDAQFVMPIRDATTLVIQIINNNELIKGRIAAVICKKQQPETSGEWSHLKSELSNLGCVHVPLDELDHWQETDEWYPIICRSRQGADAARLRVMCCRVPASVAAARLDVELQTHGKTSNATVQAGAKYVSDGAEPIDEMNVQMEGESKEETSKLNDSGIENIELPGAVVNELPY